MNIKPRNFAMLLGAGAVAAAIASAPGAAAASVTSTHDSGGSTTTQRPRPRVDPYDAAVGLAAKGVGLPLVAAFCFG
ncbi:hypothetical protein MGALJ_08100 [Mycobacterium gallinarum]|uniref:Secreted protein n=1 Tax=Mycobacterium gallinarum TaxID=39689 RepID=A0A9W4AZ99_9MYCO|nr:hypothetical protein MGALJ_08100 [Mycobacterium gallinarum]